ncbi:MAG: hypothetical protein J6Z23_00780 [Lachnospiraceae bacterium]|nr:hypothetical protein [Lachnospiraceae bacterium]
MSRKRFAAIRILAAALLAAAMCMTGLSCGMPDTGKDEIRLRIRLDLKEDIGLFLIDSEVNGQNTSGGSSNADRSMLKRDETLYWSIDRRHYENVPDAVSLTLRFRIVTEYFDPNYENIYPEEYVMPMEEIAFTAVFGGTYDFIVTGDRVNGYRAVLK